ncbi:M48 family metallopeptidase [Legionella drozanskii]|uniref:Zinc metalloprotease n=1 Tax=Legionella drozanskii LLAP-1 TaxID=1212489 RepID=A0A0W0SV86_9GAMM|nr:SprT family zinc-dependent metalloprotease [Legionella drozanskii]KTC87294.1 zinc metalloprotease [Legionella drozanskii LLAP-1]
MKKNLLEFDGLTIEVLRKPIKNIHLRIYPPDGQIKVSAPLRLHLDLIRHQIEAKREWIHAQRTKLRARSYSPPLAFETGEPHDFLGKTYSLIVHEAKHSPMVLIQQDSILCYTRTNARAEDRKILLENWYRQQMKALLPELFRKWEGIIGVTASSWGIKSMKTRWGSCNTTKRRIWLNLNLITKPLPCLEYVLVHELVHLLEASHNKRFHAFMDQFLPQWRDLKNQLEEKPLR